MNVTSHGKIWKTGIEIIGENNREELSYGTVLDLPTGLVSSPKDW